MWTIILIWLAMSGLLVWKFSSFFHVSALPILLTKPSQTNAQPTTLGVTTESTLLPSQVLDLTNWKITLPLPSANGSSNPLEVTQPDLATYKLYPWFFVSGDGKGVVFRAPVTGVTTSGSNYPRSELREMTNNGMTQANWSSTQGTHTMAIDEAITAVPKVKQQVVAGQIHDNSSDILVIRLDYPNLYVNVGGTNVYRLDSHYTLGKRFTVRFVVSGGKTDVYYNNSTNPVYTLKKDYANSYFKVGAYTQSNCHTEKSPSFCNVNNFGEVVVYSAQVTHQ